MIKSFINLESFIREQEIRFVIREDRLEKMAVQST